MTFKLYNTLSREKEEFEPIEDEHVRFYACGPTVYNYAHVGNLRAYVMEDLLKRWLIHRGYSIEHVMNITDVGHLTDDADQGEDKMLVAEEREGRDAWQIAEFYEQVFRDDLKALNVLPPSEWPKATDHIQEMIDMVETLEEKGYTYETSDGVYFDTSKLDDYGKMTPMDREKLKAGARVELGEKRNPTDFALWKFSPDDEKRHMEWDSPWGKGFPGWHIECSAMSIAYLGEQFDIHAGGTDHIPVHHTNEIAQTEGATGAKPWVRYWFHVAFLITGEGIKMSKSEGNFLRLQTIKDEGFTPRDLRFFFLQAHYRRQQQFTWEALESAAKTLRKLDDFMERLDEYDGDSQNPDVQELVDETLDRFEAAMDDDLNTPEMWPAIHDLIGDTNRLMDQDEMSAADAEIVRDAMLHMDEVLGVLEHERREVPDEAREMIEERERLREQGLFEAADEIRDTLKNEYGIQVQDTDDGPRIRFVD